jgi:peptidylprolyl isomerase
VICRAHYAGRLESSGKQFDSSYDRGRPLTFKVGSGEVIKGWDQGIAGGEGVPAMKAGGRRRLVIPPELGYGSRGAGGGIIPPNASLVFDVQYLGAASARR